MIANILSGLQIGHTSVGTILLIVAPAVPAIAFLILGWQSDRQRLNRTERQRKSAASTLDRAFCA